MKEGVVLGGFDTGRWITPMRSSCIILVACYLVCVTVFITAVLLKVTFKAVAQPKKKNPKESFNVEDVIFICFSVWDLEVLVCFHTATRHTVIVWKTAVLHRNYCPEYTVFKTLTTVWIVETWRCFAQSPVQPPLFSILLRCLYTVVSVREYSTCSSLNRSLCGITSNIKSTSGPCSAGLCDRLSHFRPACWWCVDEEPPQNATLLLSSSRQRVVQHTGFIFGSSLWIITQIWPFYYVKL